MSFCRRWTVCLCVQSPYRACTLHALRTCPRHECMLLRPAPSTHLQRAVVLLRRHAVDLAVLHLGVVERRRAKQAADVPLPKRPVVNLDVAVDGLAAGDARDDHRHFATQQRRDRQIIYATTIGERNRRTFEIHLIPVVEFLGAGLRGVGWSGRCGAACGMRVELHCHDIGCTVMRQFNHAPAAAQAAADATQTMHSQRGDAFAARCRQARGGAPAPAAPCSPLGAGPAPGRTTRCRRRS